MKNRLFVIIVLLLLLYCSLPATVQAVEEQPELVLTYAPSYGVGEPLRGFVQGISDPSRYRVTLFLQTSTGGEYWVKPTEAHPYVDLEAGGTFLLDYISGGNDVIAVALHLLVLPADYTPTVHGFLAAMEEALDYVCVTRASDGTTVIEPDRYYMGKTVSCGPDSGRILIDVGFYTDGSRPGQGLDESLITAQLDALGSFAYGVRMYVASGEVYPAYEEAQDRGLFVFGTAYLSGEKASDLAEMDALIDHCNNGRAQVAIVGNETLLSQKLTEDELLECIAYVRAGINDPSIPVTTSDSIGYFINNPRLLNACDIIMPNVYPYWEGKDISVAAESFISAVNNLQRFARGKQIVISETGWPTSGQRVGSAMPGGPAAAEYFETLWSWSLGSGIPILWFEGADEPWKVSEEGEAGGHWGFLTSELMLKENYAGLGFFQSASAGILPSVVSFDPNGGTGYMHPRSTGADHLIILPDCLFIPPEGMLFCGWLADSRLYQPGESCIFESDITVYAFWLPDNDETVILPEGLITVEEEAFAGSGIRYVIVPDGCVSIGIRAFADCSELLAVVMPESVSSISVDAFEGSSQASILTPTGSYAADWAEDNGIREIRTVFLTVP